MDPLLFRNGQPDKPKLRIGLLLDSAVLPRCFAEIVDHIEQSDFAQLELLIYHVPAVAVPPPAQRSLLSKVIATAFDSKRRKSLGYTLYQRWDQRHLDPALDPLAPVDCSARFAPLPALQVQPIGKRFVHRFPPEAIAQIQAHRLDVLIRFGFNILRGEILTSAQYGVWSYHHGDNDYYRGGPAHFWEVYENHPMSGVILQVLTEELDAGLVLCKGLFATHPGLSHVRNRTQPYWGALTFMIQKLRELHRHGWEHLKQNSVPPAPYQGKKKIYVMPTNAELLHWLGPALATKAFRRLGQTETIAHWQIAVRVGQRPLLDDAPPPRLDNFQWLESPPGRFYADPFLLQRDGHTWVFFEDYDYATSLGRISCAQLQGQGLGPVLPVLERPYHLSYPFLFEENGQLYMIPESERNGTVELYRCVDFPSGWQLERELFRGHAVDTTLWVENGRYWFFVTMLNPRGAGVQLWLFSAPSLTGEWQSHPANPISTDVRSSRNAGPIFRHNGKLFRPSQDGRFNYGSSFALNEILVLNENTYAEKPHLTVHPAWGKHWEGTHTYGRVGDVEIIDGLVRRPARQVLHAQSGE